MCIGEHLAKYNIKKVLICYGSERIKRDGLFAAVTTSLKAQQIEFVECGGIISNPLISKVHKGVEIAKTQQVDGILSVSGGSVLDSVKAIAAGAKYDQDVWDLFIGAGQITDALPLFLILTLAATGSEMNSGAVVTNEQSKQKFAINAPWLTPI